MASFNAFNTFPVKEVIIVDDSGKQDIHKQLQDTYPDYTLILKEHRGLIPCIDDAFSRITTKYLFKMEDDWEFYRASFIERSIKVLEARPDVMHIWLRNRQDTNAHPIEPLLHNASDVAYSMVTQNFLGQWHGFTFNPSVWRLADYKKLAPFTDICGKGNMGTQEMNIGYWYHEIYNARAAILNEGYVKHIGWGRRSFEV
jgi:hypothetical protein